MRQNALRCSVIFAVTLVYAAEQSGGTAPTQETQKAPSSLIVIQGACPFEGCQYGAWTARLPVALYANVNGAQLKRRIAKGNRVTAVSGEIHATPRKATVTGVYQSDEQQGIHIGDVVYVLFPLGEGAAKIWHQGKVKDGSMDLSLAFETAPSSVKTWIWWVKVRLTDGTIAWVKDPAGGFDGMDKFS